MAGGASRQATLDAQTREVSIAQGLDMYERGDRNVLTGFANQTYPRGVEYELGKVAKKWIKARGADAVPRRRLVVATFALEAAKGVSEGRRPASPVSLTEWACDLLRPPNGENVPLPAERLWHEAALAVLEGRGRYSDVMAHLWHLNTRFKNEPRALLARGWMKQGEWEAVPDEIAMIPRAGDVVIGRLGGGYSGEFVDLARSDQYRRVSTGRSFYPLSTSPAFSMRPDYVPPPTDLTRSIWATPDQYREVGRG